MRRASSATLLLLFASCSGGADVERAYHPNGAIESASAWVVDEQGTRLRDGEFTAWYDDGVVRARGAFRRGAQDGEWLQWHRNGKLGSEERWESGERTGEWRYYHETGGPLAAGSFRAGREEGLWSYWHPDGSLRARGSFLHGVRDGVWIERDERGELDAPKSGVYDAGVRVSGLERPALIAAVEAAWRERDSLAGGAR